MTDGQIRFFGLASMLAGLAAVPVRATCCGLAQRALILDAHLAPSRVHRGRPPAEAQRDRAPAPAILDLFRAHGYELVIPPLLEYLESLLTGTGTTSTCRPSSWWTSFGRMLGLRADITPQVARIDAHLLNREGVTRLCYCGSVLHTLPRGMTATREPLQIGAELYGHAGIESDVEIQRLMVRRSACARHPRPAARPRHVAVFRGLDAPAAWSRRSRIGAVPRAAGEGRAGAAGAVSRARAATRDALRLLPELYGGAEVLAQARGRLPAYPEIELALTARALAQDCAMRHRAASIWPSCAAITTTAGWCSRRTARGRPSAIALGGRYDEVGKAFGRARPATGFTMDLRELARDRRRGAAPGAILAPAAAGRGLRRRSRRCARRRDGGVGPARATTARAASSAATAGSCSGRQVGKW